MKLVRRGDGKDLYLMYRPLRFSELYGPTRKRAKEFFLSIARDGRLDKHSYLIAGPSGSGKTTLTLIISLAVNCHNRQPNPKTGDLTEPCLECASCQNILNGSMKNYATTPVKFYNTPNLLKDDTRKIIEEDLFSVPPLFSEARYRIVVFDEAHEMTKQQIQLLLTPLEDLPDWTYVFFLTSQPERIKDKALKSRLTTVMLEPWPIADLVKLAEDIVKSEEKHRGITIEFERGSLEYIASLASGNSRAMISILQPFIDGAVKNTRYTLEAVKQLAKLPDVGGLSDLTAEVREIYTDMFSGIFKKDYGRIVNALKNLEKNGENPVDIYYRVSRFLRNSVYKAAEQGNQKLLSLNHNRLMRFLEVKMDSEGDTQAKVLAAVMNTVVG